MSGRETRQPRGTTNDDRPIATLGLTHLALTVLDLAKSVRFYQQVLGARITYRDPEHVEIQTPGASDFIALEQGPRKARTRPSRVGVQHFGFRLQSPDEIRHAVATLKRAGATVLEEGEFSPGHPFVFARDPDGYVLEFWFE